MTYKISEADVKQMPAGDVLVEFQRIEAELHRPMTKDWHGHSSSFSIRLHQRRSELVERLAHEYIKISKEIIVTKPEDCPFCSECSCSLDWQIEGPTASNCPLGRYPDYEFPSDCPLKKDNYLIKRAKNEPS